MKTSRTAITDYQKCPRYRYLKFHANETGLEPRAQSVPLVWGKGIHAGVERLLKQDNVEQAVNYALDEYATQCQNRNFDLDELESQSFVYNEGKALIEGFTRAWALERLSDFLATYEILEVEHEAVWKDWAERIDLAYRPDALLRKRNTGGLYIFNLKSSYAWGDREQKASRYNVQGLSELAAVEHRLGEKVAGIQDEIFIKGSRYKQKDGSFHQSTFLVHPWLKAGITSDDDQWAWKYYYDKDGSNRSIGKAFTKVNVWEHMSMKQWVDMLASGNVQGELGNPLAELFVTPIAHERNEIELREWLIQTRHQEEVVSGHLNEVWLAQGCADAEILTKARLDSHFPMYRHSCFQYQRTCEFAPVCHERLSLDCGLYQPRIDHHSGSCGMNNYLHELADAATSRYWPPHLIMAGEDKLVSVGEALKDAITQIEYLEAAGESEEELREEIEELENELAELRKSKENE